MSKPTTEFPDPESTKTPKRFPGTNVFNVYRSDGARIGRWEAPVGVTDEKLLLALSELLARADPPRLTLVGRRGPVSVKANT